jgi:hypothetical protein
MNATSPKSDVTRWRQKARDPKARAAHAADTTSWRRSLAEADFGPEEQAELIENLRAGLRITEAAAAVGMTANAVYGRARWDVEFGNALEQVLAETCPAGDMCGRPAGGEARRALRGLPPSAPPAYVLIQADVAPPSGTIRQAVSACEQEAGQVRKVPG